MLHFAFFECIFSGNPLSFKSKDCFGLYSWSQCKGVNCTVQYICLRRGLLWGYPAARCFAVSPPFIPGCWLARQLRSAAITAVNHQDLAVGYCCAYINIINVSEIQKIRNIQFRGGHSQYVDHSPALPRRNVPVQQVCHWCTSFQQNQLAAAAEVVLLQMSFAVDKVHC